jgi:hypothetical protein
MADTEVAATEGPIGDEQLLKETGANFLSNFEPMLLQLQQQLKELE